jgi:hypothetical protein
MIITIEDIKVYIANAFTLTVSMTSVDMVFKTLLFLATFGYTIHQWILMIKRNKDYGKGNYKDASKEEGNS